MYKYREGRPSDLNFILATWLRRLWSDNPVFREIGRDTYFENYSIIAKRILQRPHVQVRVCCLEDDDDVILGYSVFEGTIVHWIFMKYDWRKQKLTKDLLPPVIERITHLTRDGQRMWKAKFPKAEFNPFF